MKIDITDKGQILIPDGIRDKIEGLGNEIISATAHLSHWERRGVMGHICDLLKMEAEKPFFKIP